MEKERVQYLTSAVLKKLTSDVEEKKRALNEALDSLQARYDADNLSLEPSAVAKQVPSAKATADLEAALRKISELEMQNKTLQERLKEKEEKAKQLEENLHAEKVKSDVDRKHSEELTNDLLKELQKIKSDTETTKSQFISEIKRLEGELEAEGGKQGLQHEVSRAERVDQAAQTEELEPAQEDEDLRQKLIQEQLANAGAKTLQAKLRAEIERLQKRLNEEIRSKNDHKVYIRKLEEGRGVKEQPNTARQQQPQPTNAAPRPQQERTQRLLDQEIQSHKSTKSLVQRLEDENNRLKESLKIQEQHTANASRQNQLKKERLRYDELLKVYNKEVEESKQLKNKVNVLTCRLRQHDFKNGLIRNNREAEMMTADQECQSEVSVLDLEEVKISEQQLKLYYQNQLDKFSAENSQLLARLDNSERNNNDIQLRLRRSKEQQQRDTKMLRSQLQTEQQKNNTLLLSLNKSKKAEEEKQALEKSVATLRSELNREKSKGLSQMKELEKRLDDERKVFKLTIQKCSAAYHAVAAKSA